MNSLSTFENFKNVIEISVILLKYTKKYNLTKLVVLIYTQEYSIIHPHLGNGHYLRIKQQEMNYNLLCNHDKTPIQIAS